MAWNYHRGIWTVIEDPTADWNNEGSWEDYLTRKGYAAEVVFGDPDGLGFTVHSSVNPRLTEVAPYLVEMYPTGSSIQMVIIDDYPSVLQFVNEYSSAFMLKAIYDRLDEILDSLRKGGGA
jgi:hypothetical protein